MSSSGKMESSAAPLGNVQSYKMFGRPTRPRMPESKLLLPNSNWTTLSARQEETGT